MLVDKIKSVYRGEVNTLNHSENVGKVESHIESIKAKEEVLKDSIDISEKAKKVSKISERLNQHATVNSTVYVDTSTILKIMSFSTYNKEYQWSEMGIDGDKRYVVINGQRFESPLSEEEKRMRENACKTMLDYIKEAEDENAERKAKRGLKTNLSLGEDGNLKLSDEIEDSNLSNLMNNDVVQKMFKEMMSKGILGTINISI